MQNKTAIPIADMRAARIYGGNAGNARIWLAAASLLFIAAVGSWLFYNFKQEPEIEALALKQESTDNKEKSLESIPSRTSDQVVPKEEAKIEYVKPRTLKERTTVNLESSAKDKAPKEIANKQAEKAEAGLSSDAEVTASAAIAATAEPTAVYSEQASAPVTQKKAMPSTRSATLAEEALTARDDAREKVDIKDLYARGQYQALLDNYKNDNSQEALLFKGQSHYQLHQYRQALQTLQHVSSAHLLYEAEWVSANCYLELNKTTKAKTLFDKLSKETGPHQKEAEERSKKLPEN
jgi:hypothetical protein